MFMQHETDVHSLHYTPLIFLTPYFDFQLVLLKNDLQYNTLCKYSQAIFESVMLYLICVKWHASWFGDLVWWASWCCYFCEEWKNVWTLIYLHTVLINYILTWIWVRWSVICMNMTTGGERKWISAFWIMP